MNYFDEWLRKAAQLHPERVDAGAIKDFPESILRSLYLDVDNYGPCAFEVSEIVQLFRKCMFITGTNPKASAELQEVMNDALAKTWNYSEMKVSTTDIGKSVELAHGLPLRLLLEDELEESLFVEMKIHTAATRTNSSTTVEWSNWCRLASMLAMSATLQHHSEAAGTAVNSDATELVKLWGEVEVNVKSELMKLENVVGVCLLPGLDLTNR